MLGGVAVRRHLLERDIPHEFFSSPALRHAAELPAALGVSPSECVGVHVFEGAAGTIIALLPLSSEPDPLLVAEAAGEPDVRRASAATISHATGFPAEWAAPVAPASCARVLVDKTLVDRDVLYAPGGQPGLVLKIRGGDLLAAAGGTTGILGQPAAGT